MIDNVVGSYRSDATVPASYTTGDEKVSAAVTQQNKSGAVAGKSLSIETLIKRYKAYENDKQLMASQKAYENAGKSPRATSDTKSSEKENGTEAETTSSAQAMVPDASANGGAKNTANNKTAAANPEDLSDEEKREVAELKATDKEVRTHEQAHMSAGAGVVSGGPSYEEVEGPDGNMYAVGGEVPIDTSEASTPEATIVKAQKIIAAAMAPANPSSQDRSVAAYASQMQSEARQEKAENDRNEQTEKRQTGDSTAAPSKGTDVQNGRNGKTVNANHIAEVYSSIAEMSENAGSMGISVEA